jgi:hypothetical protein
LNTNADFDFGSFEKLGDDIKRGENIQSYLFTFSQAGIYVFRDSEIAAKETIIAIMKEGGSCPKDFIFESVSYKTLLRVGAALRNDISLTPDWTFFVVSCIGFLVLVLLSAMTVTYVFNRNWDQDPARKAISY